jgi:hypothetical protein
MTAAEIAAALGGALALAAQEWKCFPCAANKIPTTPHGFRDATSDPFQLRELWCRHPGPLVGVPTGEASGFDVFDIDAPRHREAADWWIQNQHRLPTTRIHQTRSGGRHVLFRHAAGLRCSASRIVPGIDVRSTGGYVIWWPGAGEPVLSDTPLVPWPQWLLDALMPPRPGPAPRHAAAWIPPSDYRARSRYVDAALRHSAYRVAQAPTGLRNSTLNRETFGLGRLIAEGLLDAQYVADELAAAAVSAGLAPREIEATLRSAFRARGLL